MQLTIPIRALSVNKASKGRHFKTLAYRQYEVDVCKLLPFAKRPLVQEEYFAKYVFYIKNYSASDTGNMEKLITDLLVKRNYIEDDRFIKAMYLIKEKVTDISDEKIIIDIVPYADRYKILHE